GHGETGGLRRELKALGSLPVWLSLATTVATTFRPPHRSLPPHNVTWSSHRSGPLRHARHVGPYCPRLRIPRLGSTSPWG
ncbi:hypothetical protein ABZT51_52575, partial [Streptomyces sp. NPDC005373]|uniref:hypothetical protein n=1 Tax=Streptomyces sp. NPDC005373 TaxID=3156879 RepID=UPI0033A98DDD